MFRIKKILILFFLAFPALAFAHATPVLYVPTEGGALPAFPQEVAIRFSERVEPSASSMKLFPPQGGAVPLTAYVDVHDPRRLFARFDAMMLHTLDGTYTVSWQVVSADDGHYTKGAYQFVVGTSTKGAGTSAAPTVEMVHSSGYGEASVITLKLLGEAFLLGVIALFFLIGRSVHEREIADSVIPRLLVSGRRFFGTGVLLLGVGGVSYFALKTYLLAEAQGASLPTAFLRFLPTTAGGMTLILLLLLYPILLLGRGLLGALIKKEKIGVRGVLTIILLLALSYTQARLSHAAASLILPHFSVFVNMVHLLGKGLWVGGLCALVFVVHPALLGAPLQDDGRRVVRFGFGCLTTLATLLGGVSGAWIVWLHLKSFANIFTPWGGVFIWLFASAATLLALRLIALFYFERRSWTFGAERLWLGGEAVVGVVVTFFSALIIITSPPLHYAALYSSVDTNHEGVVHLYDPGEGKDGLALMITAPDGSAIMNAFPTVTLTNPPASVGPIVLHPKLQNGVYLIPESDFVPPGEWEIRATFTRDGAYDLNAKFTIDEPALPMAMREKSAHPMVGVFSIILALLAIGAVVGAGILMHIVRRNDELSGAGVPGSTPIVGKVITGSVLIIILAVGALVLLFVPKLFENGANMGSMAGMDHSMPM